MSNVNARKMEEKKLGGVPAGNRAIILRLCGGRRFAARLAEMGFLPGAPIRALKNDSAGPVVVELRGSRLALGRRMADRIVVRSI